MEPSDWWILAVNLIGQIIDYCLFVFGCQTVAMLTQLNGASFLVSSLCTISHTCPMLPKREPNHHWTWACKLTYLVMVFKLIKFSIVPSLSVSTMNVDCCLWCTSASSTPLSQGDFVYIHHESFARAANILATLWMSLTVHVCWCVLPRQQTYM